MPSASLARPAPLVLVAIASLFLAGCTAPPPGTPREPAAGAPGSLPPATAEPPPSGGLAGAAWPRGVHPWPAGDEWPRGLAGPFEALPPERAAVPGHGGAALAAWVWRPAVPEGVRVPVVLASTPYPVDEAWMDDGSVPRERLVREGFAVVAASVRGTGASGGCFDWGGAAEQADQAALVAWAAAQPWSNGRVGMVGVSYLAATAMEAAVAAPPALKTIVVAGVVGDLYTFVHTPQGAAFAGGPEFLARFGARSLLGDLLPGPGGPPGPPGPPRLPPPDRACAGAVEPSAVVAAGIHTDHRDPAFWEPRRYEARMPGVAAAVLLAHGFQDNLGSGHRAEEDGMWARLAAAPKWQLEGQWGHGFPGGSDRPGPPDQRLLADWEDRLVAWLDFWLRGLGGPPARLGRVDYQDSAGGWREAAAWPPPEAVVETWLAAGGSLGPGAAGPEASFTARPAEGWPDAVACGGGAGGGRAGAAGMDSAGVLFVSEPASAPRVLAGNPAAVLVLESSAPGGIVSADLFDLGPEAGCAGGAWEGAARIATGSADLRFLDDRHRGRDFPVGQAREVRLDLTNLAHVVGAGHRLALLVSHSDGSRAGQPFEPVVTLRAGTGLGLPFLPPR